jgi:PAS domain S-box-containing protein
MTRILVVEDERIVAEDIKRSLQNLGYMISAVVSSGEEAIQKIEDKTPDLVLMDIVLKGDMDGIEAAEKIHDQFTIPVVYLTAYADEKRLQRAKVTEPYGYILKPFEDKELHTTIETALYKHEMEKKVIKSEQWLTTILKSIGDGVIVTDTEGVITFMNPVAETLTGWTQKEAAGNRLEEVFYTIDEDIQERRENLLEKIIKTEKTVNLESNTLLVARDGTRRPISDSGAPITDDNHTLLGTVFVFRDMTEERKMEENLHKLEMEKMESLTILAGGIAHDFNNILTVVLSNITLAKMSMSSVEELLKILAEMEKILFKAKNLTHQLLTFSKDGVCIRKPASIAELLKDTTEFAVRGSSVTCEFQIPEDLQSAEIDAGQISQVINNVVINAEQAMPEGGVIRICAENVVVNQKDGLPLKEGNYVLISIKDEGIGIREEHLKRVFDPYFTTKQRGSGLGLATSYSIVKNHGGHIAVESEAGVGTAFHMWLPASGKEVVAEEEPNGLVRGSGKILLMDDDESILEATLEVLKFLGYKPEFSKNGSDAITLYMEALNAGRPFDAVVMDLTIPGGWGARETIEELMRIDPYVKTIVSSGYSDHPVMVNYRKYGFRGAIAKPYSAEELSTILHGVLRSSG